MSRELNIIKILRSSMEEKVKEAVIDKIVADQLVEIENKIRKKIKPIVNEISFKSIDRLKDLAGLRDEIHVFLHWDDEDKPITIDKTEV